MYIQKDYLNKIILWGLGHMNDHTLYLTNSGKLLADQIASDLFMED